MTRPPPPTDHALLLRMTRLAMSRGLPREDAEDVVVHAWEQARSHHDPGRGRFDDLLATAVRNGAASWWRKRSVRQRAEPTLTLHEVGRRQERVEPATRSRAREAQRRLLEALDEDERAVFHTWALQRHLPRGRLRAPEAAARLGLDVPAYEAAKKRLGRRIRALLEAWDMDPRDLLPLPDDVGARKEVSRG